MWLRAMGLAVAWLAPLAHARDVPIIPPAEARHHLGQRVIVLMVVRSARHLEEKSICILNSEKDDTDKQNLAILLSADAIKHYQDQGVTNLPEFFLLKRIRVVGLVSLYENRPRVRVRAAKSITFVPVDR